MNFIPLICIAFTLILTCVCKDLAINTVPELKKNVLNFGYGVNFKYMGMLSHSFDIFYVVTKFEIPKIQDLRLTSFSFDLTCNYLNICNSYMHWYIKHCKRSAPYVNYTRNK